MAQQQVFVVMQRTDIPSGVLQMTELKPNDSQRNYIYEPPGQTQYVKNIPTQSVVATTGAGPITTNASYQGLAAYLIDTIEQDTSVDSITAAMANDTATDIVAALAAGTLLDEPTVNALLVANGASAGTGLTLNGSIASLTDLLGIAAGRVYVVPAGSEIAGGGAAFPGTAQGSFTNDDEIKQLYETSAFRISNGDGQIAGFKRTDFDYLGTQAAAVTVYAADGTLL